MSRYLPSQQHSSVTALHSSCHGALPHSRHFCSAGPLTLPSTGHVPRSSVRSFAGLPRAGLALPARPGPSCGRPGPGPNPGLAAPGQSRTRGWSCRSTATNPAGAQPQPARADTMPRTFATGCRALIPRLNRSATNTHRSPSLPAPPPRTPTAPRTRSRQLPRQPLTASLTAPQPTARQPQHRCSRFWIKALICHTWWGFEWRVHLCDWWEINFRCERNVNLSYGQETPVLSWPLGADTADSPGREPDNIVHNRRLQGVAGISFPILLIQQSRLPGRWGQEWPSFLPTAASPLWGGEAGWGHLTLFEACWNGITRAERAACTAAQLQDIPVARAQQHPTHRQFIHLQVSWSLPHDRKLQLQRQVSEILESW